MLITNTSFNIRFKELVSKYYASNKLGIVHYTGKNSIYEYLLKHYNGFCPSESTFKKWYKGISMPALEQMGMLCEFFGCDITYLLGLYDGYLDCHGNVLTDKITKYIWETYGLEKDTLHFLENNKRLVIASTDDDSTHNTAPDSESFSALFNKLLQKEPWLVINLLQILHASDLNLSDRGFSQRGDVTITDDLRAHNDVNYSLALLGIKIKKLLSDKKYMPNSNQLLSPYDKSITDSEVNEYISTLLSSRLEWLNNENSLLTKILTEYPYSQDELDDITELYLSSDGNTDEPENNSNESLPKDKSQGV